MKDRFFLMKEYGNDSEREPEFIEVESLSKSIIYAHECKGLGNRDGDIPGLEFGKQKWWYELHTLKTFGTERWC